MGTNMQEAAALVPEGAVLMIGSFMGVGTPSGWSTSWPARAASP
jgi:hypothetical protein